MSIFAATQSTFTHLGDGAEKSCKDAMFSHVNNKPFSGVWGNSRLKRQCVKPFSVGNTNPFTAMGTVTDMRFGVQEFLQIIKPSAVWTAETLSVKGQI